MRGHALLERMASVPRDERDVIIEALLGLRDLPATTPLPAEHINHHMSGVLPIVQAVVGIPVVESDVFVDLGSGAGKAALLVGMLTGARVVGVEIQEPLVEFARDRARVHNLDNVTFIHGDARDVDLSLGDVFFFYVPFTGAVLEVVMEKLRCVAEHKPITIAALGVDLGSRPWLTERKIDSFWLSIHDSDVAKRRGLTSSLADLGKKIVG